MAGVVVAPRGIAHDVFDGISDGRRDGLLGSFGPLPVAPMYAVEHKCQRYAGRVERINASKQAAQAVWLADIACGLAISGDAFRQWCQPCVEQMPDW